MDSFLGAGHRSRTHTVLIVRAILDGRLGSTRPPRPIRHQLQVTFEAVRYPPGNASRNLSAMVRTCRTASSITRSRSALVVRRIGMYSRPSVSCASPNSFSACQMFPWTPEKGPLVSCSDQIGVMPQSAPRREIDAQPQAELRSNAQVATRRGVAVCRAQTLRVSDAIRYETTDDLFDQVTVVDQAARHVHGGDLVLPQRQEFANVHMIGQSAKLNNVLPKSQVPSGVSGVRNVSRTCFQLVIAKVRWRQPAPS